MILPLYDLELCKQGGIIERSRDLAHAAADAVHRSPVFVGCCRPVAVSHRKGMHTFITGKYLSRHQHMAVNLPRTDGKVRGTGCAAAAEVRGKGSQNVLNRRQLLSRHIRLLLDHSRFYMNLFCLCAVQSRF